MKKILLCLSIVLLSVVNVWGQNTPRKVSASDIQYWIGSGSSTAILVINWYDEEILAFGYRFSDPNSEMVVADMLNEFNDSLPGIYFDGSGFIDDITYTNSCLGLNLSGYNYTGSSTMAYWMYAVNNVMANYGIDSQPLTNGDVIYWEYKTDWTSWDVALDSTATITYPSPHDCDPDLDFADINWWVGSGSNEAMLILDFTFDNEAVAFGYRWNGNAVVEDMLQAFLDSCQGFTFTGLSSGFITNIAYEDAINNIFHNDTNATTFGYWMYALNNGFADAVNTQVINDGDVVYFEYHTDMNNWDVVMPQDLAPVYPTRPIISGIETITNIDITLSPVPTVDLLTINASESMIKAEIVAMNGMVLMTEVLDGTQATLNVGALSQGIYMLRATMADNTIKNLRFIKK
ncbi:MAG: DUF4430 domain-containing protein [Bacteroidales bacterium]|nr:DUF4430 domain-containing protein [Bacteroidales bacterium]